MLYFTLLPSITILIGSFIFMMLATKIGKERSINLASYILVLALLFELFLFSELGSFNTTTLFNGTLFIDKLSGFFTITFILLGLIASLSARYYMLTNDIFKPEFFAMLLLAIFGMIMLSNSSELITSFVALEIVSISIYTLVAIKKDINASEAVIKYFLLGAFIGAFFVMGSSFIFGQVGSTKFIDISSYLATHDISEMPLLASGLLLIFVALFFKITAFPFHAWSIDVYTGATLPVTNIMNSAVKLASFALILRILSGAFDGITEIWQPILFYVTIATMFIGNIMSIKQDSVKKMLISSSIVHTGYLLVCLSSIQSFDLVSVSPIIFYLFAYSLAVGGTFLIISSLAKHEEKFLHFDDFKGLSRARPLMALALTIFMLNFIGFPFTMGFLGKFHLFSSATSNGIAILALFGVINTILSVYYYLRLIIKMYFFEPERSFGFDVSKAFIFAIASIITTLIAGGFGLISIDDLVLLLT